MPSLQNLAARQIYGNTYYCNDLYDDCGYESNWDRWGRWVLLAAIIVTVLAIFIVLSCMSARSRRRAGRQPLAGTAWLAPQHGPVSYNPNQTQSPYYPPNNTGGYAEPAPPYNAANEGYYGQQSGIEMQPPQQAYGGRGGDGVYAPPPGPPPRKA